MRCELVVWVFSWQVLNILSFRSSPEEEISSGINTISLDDVEIDLLRSPQSFEDSVLRYGLRIYPRLPDTWDKAIDFYRSAMSAKIHLELIYLINHSSNGTYLDWGLDQTVKS